MRCSGVAAALLLAGMAAGRIGGRARSSTNSRNSACGCSISPAAICHTRPLLTAGMYGPELSRETAGGNQEVVRGIITDGTPRMPGFKYHFNQDQIAAIAAYLSVLPPGSQADRPAGPSSDRLATTHKHNNDFGRTP